MVDILESIPHRPPFLFVDRVIRIDGESILAEKYLDPKLDFFSGHYPDFPIMPGVLTCECLFQTGAILLSHRAGDNGDGAPVITRIRDARFKKMILPGQMISLEVEVEENVGQAWYMKGRAKVDGKLAVSVGFTCAMVRGMDKQDG